MTIGHVSDELPKHPLLGTNIFRQEQFHPLLIKILPDADMIYIKDNRWDQADKDEKTFALQVISKIAGNVYPVISMDKDGDDYFYNILVRPKFNTFDYMGAPTMIGYAFVPVNYTTVVKSGFPEAK